MNTSPVAIGEIIRNGVIFDFKNWDKARMNADRLASTVERLFILLNERQVAFTLVGGVALLQYVEGRNTQDIDLIVALSSLERLPEIGLNEQNDNFARGEFDGLQIDILLTHNPLFARVQSAHATPQPFAERTIQTATVTGLILLKLYALPSLYRQGDFARVGLYENDVATLLYAYRPDVQAILSELSAYVNDADMREIRGIVADLQTRFSRFTNPSSPTE